MFSTATALAACTLLAQYAHTAAFPTPVRPKPNSKCQARDEPYIHWTEHCGEKVIDVHCTCDYTGTSTWVCAIMAHVPCKPTAKPPLVCCKALNAQCLACAAGLTEAEYCATRPGTPGCKPPRYSPCDGKHTGEQCTACDPLDKRCLETRVLKTCNTDGKCTPGFARPGFGDACLPGTPDYVETTTHCGKQLTTMRCSCDTGAAEWQCMAIMLRLMPCPPSPPSTPKTTFPPITIDRQCDLTECKAGYTCVEGKGCVLDRPITLPTQKPTAKPPPVCCKALNAQCLACAAGLTEAEYCTRHPGTPGCKLIQPITLPTAPACCEAMTASCLSCAAGMTQAEYCSTNPITYGCKNTKPEPKEPTCENRSPKFCDRRLGPKTTLQYQAKLCKRKNFTRRCQQSCRLC